MAGTTVDYIIRLLRDDSDLKKQLKATERDISKLNAHERAEVKATLQARMDGLAAQAKAAKKSHGSGSVVDTKSLETELNFIKEVFREMKSLNPAEDWAKSGKVFAQTFTNMHNQLSDLANLVETLRSSVTELGDAFKNIGFNVTPTVDMSGVIKQTDAVADGVVRVSQGFTVLGEQAGKAAVETNKAIEDMEKHLSSIGKLFDKDYNITIGANIDQDFEQAEKDIKSTLKQIKSLEKQMDSMSVSDKDFGSTRDALLQKYVRVSELRRQQMLRNDRYAKDDPSYKTDMVAANKELEDQISGTRKRIADLIDDAKVQLRDVTKSNKTTRDGINIPIKLPTQADLIKTINKYIDGINESKAIHAIKIKTDDPANIIEDKTIRGYNGKPEDYDANTTDLVKKTEDRFKKVLGAVKNGQDEILKRTQTWRADMLKELKFKNGDFEFNFGGDLFQSLQDYLNEQGNELKFVIDQDTIKEQLKTIIENSGLTIGGLGGTSTAVVDANAIAKAVYAGMQAAVNGQPLPSFDTTPTTKALEDTAESVTDIVNSSDKYVKTITEKTINSERVIEALRKFATDSTTKKGAGRQNVAKWLIGKGINIDAINQGASDDVIRDMLNEALMKKDRFGYASGALFADALSADNLKSFGVTSDRQKADVANFVGEIVEMLNRMGINQEYWQESQRRYQSYESYVNAAKYGRPIATLSKVRKPLYANSMKNFADSGYKRLTDNKYIGDLDSLVSLMDGLSSEHITKANQEIETLQQKAVKLKSEFEALDVESEDAKKKLDEATAEYDRLNAIPEDQLTQKDIASRIKAKKELDEATKHYAWNRRDSQDKKKEYLRLVSYTDKDGNRHAGLIEQMQQREKAQHSVYRDAKNQILSFKDSILGLGDNPSEEAINALEQVARNFFEQSGKMMQKLFSHYGDMDTFQGRVTLQNGRVVDISNPYHFLGINDDEVADVDVYNDILMKRWERSRSVKKGIPQDFEHPGYYVNRPKPPADIENERIESQEFVPIDVEKTPDLTGAIKAVEYRVQQLSEENKSATQEVEQLTNEIQAKEQEVERLLGLVNALSDAEKQALTKAAEKAEKTLADRQDKQKTEQENLKKINADIYTAEEAIKSLQNPVTSEEFTTKYNDFDHRIAEITKNNANLEQSKLSAYDAYEKALLEHEEAKKAYDNYIEKLVKEALQEASKSGDIKKLAEEREISDLEAMGILRNKFQKDFNLSGREDISTLRRAVTEAGMNVSNTRGTGAKDVYDRIAGQFDSNNKLIERLKQERDSLTIEAMQAERDAALRQKQSALQELQHQKKLAENRLKRAQNTEQSSADALANNVVLQQIEAEKELKALRLKLGQLSGRVEETGAALTAEQTAKERLGLQSQYNELKTQELKLQREIEQLEDGDVKNTKLAELEAIVQKLSEVEAKIVSLGGTVNRVAQKEYTEEQKKGDALRQAEEIQKKLIEARAQQRAYQREVDDITKLEENVRHGGLTSSIGKRYENKFKSDARSDFMRSEYYHNVRDQKKETLNQELDKFASEQAQDIIAQIEKKKDDIRNQVIQKVLGKKNIDLNAIRKTAIDEYIKTDGYKKVMSDASATRMSRQADADSTFNREVDEYINNLVATEIAKKITSADIDKKAKDQNISVEDARKAIEQEIRRDVEQQYKEEIRQFRGQANIRKQEAYASAKIEEQKARSDARQYVGQVAVDKEIEKIAKDKASEIKRKQETAIKEFEMSVEYSNMHETALNNVKQKQHELWDVLDEEMKKMVSEYIAAIKADKGKVKITDDRFRSVFNNFIAESQYSLSGQGEVDLKQYILDELAKRKVIAKGESDAGGKKKQEYIKGLPRLIADLEKSLGEALTYGGFEREELANSTLLQEIIDKTAKLKFDEQELANKEQELTNAITELQDAQKQNKDTKPYKDRVKELKAEIHALEELIDREESEIENANEQIALRVEEKAASSKSLSNKLADAEQRLATSKEKLANVKQEIADLEKTAKEAEAAHGKDSSEAERARLNLLYKQRAQKTLEKSISRDEKRVQRWSGKVAAEDVVAPASGENTSTRGGIFSGVIAEMKEIAHSMGGGATIDVDNSDIATETTLRAIFELLSGGGQASADLDAEKARGKAEREARRKEEQARVIAENKQKRIEQTTESNAPKEDGKKPSKTARAKAKLSVEGQTKFNAIQAKGREAYGELAKSDEKTILQKIDAKAKQFKNLTKGTEEYLQAQYELSNMVFAYTSKLQASGVTSKAKKNGEKYLDYKDVLDRSEIKAIGDIKSLMIPSKDAIADGLVKLGFGAKLGLNRPKDSTDLDIGPVVETADDVAQKLIERFGKALPIEDLRTIVGNIASDLLISTGDPSRKIDRFDFYEQNYDAIVEKSLEKASLIINDNPTKDHEAEEANWVNQYDDEALVKRFKHLLQLLSENKASDLQKTELNKITDLLRSKGLIKDSGKQETAESEQQLENERAKTAETQKQVENEKKATEASAEVKVEPTANNDVYKKAVETVRNAIGGFSMRSSNAKKAEQYNALGQEVKDAGNVIYKNLENATKEEKALFEKLTKLRDAASKISNTQVIDKPIDAPKVEDVNQEIEQEDAVDDELDPQVKEQAYQMLQSMIGQLESFESRIAELEGVDNPDAKAEKESLQKDVGELKENISNLSEMLGDEDGDSDDEERSDEDSQALLDAINNVGEKVTTEKPQETTSSIADSQSSERTTAQGGILGAINNLAKESTLQKVLTSLGEIAKKNAMAGAGKQNSAQDLLEQFRRMLESDAWEGRERVAYVDLATGSMSNSITGDDKSISAERLNILRTAYKDIMDLNAQVHTHANEEDPYFSKDDLSLFASDFADGITKQILLSKNNMTVLDMTDVKDVSGLLDALAKTEQNFEALATTASNFGAKYVSRAFNEITPQGLVKMLGIKGIESKYTETETRDSAVQGMLEEDAKVAADMLQESTGRAIKKTVERVGAELMTVTEKTDAKGNKTWSNQISDKYTKAALATNKAFKNLGLENEFGIGTDAQLALVDYTNKYEEFLRLTEEFKKNPNQEGLQVQFDKLLPELDAAEEKLNKLIVSKDKFLNGKEAIKIFEGADLANAGDSLKNLATSRYTKNGLNPGDNIAFNGISETPNGTRLLIDILKDGTIQQYALEVDKATGQVKEFMVAETALANAFQNVNKAMRYNETVMASVAMGGTPAEQVAFMNDAHSFGLDAYKEAMASMEKYVADIWNRMAKGGASASKEELDYIMALSERVITLGKNVQKTSIDFKNFWAQNPDNVFGHTIYHQGYNRDDRVREELEGKAKAYASASNAEYNFSSFDSDTLQFTLTDAEGKISKITYAWNELYQQIAMVSDKSTSTLDPMVAKINKYDDALQQAIRDGYLMADDKNFNAFYKATDGIRFLVGGIEQGYETFDTAKDKLYELRQEALKYGEEAKKTVTQNKRLFAGTGAKKSVDNQYNKILGVRQTGGEDFEDQFTDNSKLFKAYNDAYAQLNVNYQKYVDSHKLNDPKIQQQIQQEAAKVQTLGKRYLSSVTQAEKLKELVGQSGTYIDRKTGQEIELGGTTNVTATEVANLKAKMLDYVENGLKQANIEGVKFDSVNQKLTYTFRTSKNTVADMVVQYNDATSALYAYQKQERESLTGLPGFMHSMKAKMRSILQYTASITSIYRVFGELKRGIQYIKEIDSALTELRKVTDETEESYDRFLKTAAKTADKVGSTIKEVVSSTADWARLGYSLQEAATLAESTSVLLNVSEFQSIDEATSALTSTLQAFSYTAEQSMDVVDVLNEVGNNFAVSSDGIATALQDSASSLVAANNSYEQAVALVAAANRVVQDPNSVGAALRTISLRLRSTSTKELEEAGEDTDGAITSTSKLQSKVKGLTGVDILTDTGSYRSTYDILLDISKVWKDMSDVDQAALLEIIAGKTRSNTAAAILSNTKDLKAALLAAQEAEGSALRENEKYLDSIQGRIDLFNNSVQTMWNNALDDDVVKFFVNIGTQLIKWVDNLGLIKTLIMGIGTYLIQKHFKGDLLGGLFGNAEPQTVSQMKEALKKFQKTRDDAATELAKDTNNKSKQKKLTQAQSNLDAYKESVSPKIKEYDELSEKLSTLKDQRQSLVDDISHSQSHEDFLGKKMAAGYDVASESIDNARANTERLQGQINKIDQEIVNTENALKNVEIQTHAVGKAGMTARQKFKAGFNAAKTAVWKFGKQIATSMLTMYAITTVLELITKLGHGLEAWVDSWYTSPEELQEEFEELNNKLSQTKSEIRNLEDELETANERMEELLDQSTLTFIEQEELSKLQATTKELERQISLQETLQKSQQQGVNAASINATDAYLNTSFTSDKTRTERQEESAETWGNALSAIGLIAGAALAFFTGGSSLLLTGAGIGALAGNIAGQGVGKAVGGASYDSEQTVAEAMDSMLATRAKLKQEQNNALADKDTEAYNEATEALRTYDEQMATHISQIQANYNAMDWEIASPEDREKMIEYADWLDKYNISMGAAGAKSNAISRIFGDEASDVLKDVKERMQEVAKAGGELNLQDAFEGNTEAYYALTARLRDLGLTIYETELYFKDQQKAAEAAIDSIETYDAIKAIQKLTSGVNDLKNAFKELHEEGIVSAETLLGLEDVFGDIDGWDEFFETMSSGTATLEEAEEKAKKLAENYVDGLLSSGTYSAKEYVTYISHLQSLGVTNAKDFIDAKLKKSMASDIALKVKDGENTNEAIKAVEEEYGIKLDGENDRLLIEKAITAEKAKQAESEAKSAKSAYDAEVSKRETIKSEFDNLDAPHFIEKYGDQYGITTSKTTSTKGSGTKTVYNYQGKTYRHIGEIKDLILEEILAGMGDLPIEVTEVDVSNAEEAAQVAVSAYQEELDNHGLTLEINLIDPSELVDEAQNIYDTLASAAKEYGESGYVSVDTLQSLLQLEPKYLALLYDENGQLNLNKESLYQLTVARVTDMGIQQAQQVIETARNTLLDGNIEKLKELTEVTYGQATSNWDLVKSNLALLKTEMADKDVDSSIYDGIESQVLAIQDLTNTTIANIGNTISSSGNTAAGEIEDAFQKLMDYYDNRISANQAKYDQIQNDIDWLESQGKMADVNYYQDQIDLMTTGEESKEELLKAKLQGASDRLKELEAAGKKGSDEWWEAASIYNDTLSELDDIRDTVLSLQDAIGEVEWSVFEEFNTRLDDITSKLETMRDLIAPDGEDDWFDDEGNWTEKGVAVLGSYVQELEYYKNGLTEASEALDAFQSKEYNETNKDWFAKNYGIHSEQEYYDYLQKLTDEQYKYATAVSDTEQDIASMYESSIDATEEYIGTLIENYNDYIDVVKESLDAERDLYKFKKDVAKQTKDIGQLERRIAALSGSTNASDIAERRKLEAELYESRESLNDTYYEHSMDSQQEALDKEAQAYEEAMNNFVENLRTNLDLALTDMDGFIAGVTTAVTSNAPLIVDEYGKLGIALDSAIISPWQEAKDKMADYTKEDGLGLMNSWTAEGGVFDTFATNATEYLTSIWDDTNVDPDDAFSTAITDKVEGIKESIRTNVETAKGYLTDLYNVKDTSLEEPPVTGSKDVGNRDNNNRCDMSKNDVKNLQNVLNTVYSAKLDVDGSYGSKTKAAVKSVQQQHGIYASGLYDAATHAAMLNYIRNQWQSKNGSSSAIGQGIRAMVDILPSSYYAKGTLGMSQDQLAITDESWIGEEITLAAGKHGQLQYLKKGSAVMPADISANLVEWGKLNPSMMNMPNTSPNINMISNAINKPELNLSFDSLVKADKITEDTLPEIKKFVSQEIDNLVKKLNYALKGVGSR